MACFSGPDPVLGKPHRPQLRLHVWPAGEDSGSWVAEMFWCRCWAGIFTAQNCCRLGASAKAVVGDMVRGHQQQWQSRSSVSCGWGLSSVAASSPWWMWLLPRRPMQSSSALVFLKRLLHYPWFSWTHSICLNFDFSWVCLVCPMPVMFFKKSFSLSMNVYGSNLSDQKGFTFFFL